MNPWISNAVPEEFTMPTDPAAKPTLDLQQFKSELFVLYRRLIQSGAWTEPDWKFSKLIWTVWIEAKDCKVPAPEPVSPPARPSDTPATSALGTTIPDASAGQQGQQGPSASSSAQLHAEPTQEHSLVLDMLHELRRNRGE